MTRKLLFAALLFLTACCFALLWTVAMLAELSLWIPGAITAGSLLLVLLTLVIRALLAQRAASGLEQMFKKQAADQANLTRPDLRLEVSRMQAEFEKSIAALKQASSGRKRSATLYRLPWYAIIGPPGAGKSTALRNSGLRFPYLGGRKGAVKGLGGTRNCDWWLANEGVVLDTAGRWSTEEEDRDEWLAFLGLLKKHRARKPLNGLIIAVSIGDVVTVGPSEAEGLAERMRERIDEVVSKLGVALPVYVMFTKCDLAEGFVDVFGDLRPSERRQVWGFTIPLSAGTTSLEACTEECLQELSDVLQRRALGRLSEERGLARRQRIYRFPQQFDLMRRSLQAFLEVVFQPNAYRETPILRGVYFTSGTQEGRPFNLLLKELGELIGVQERLGEHDVVDQKSYFLHDTLVNVVFQDADLATESDAARRRSRIQRVATTVGLALVTAGFSIIPGTAWVQNRSDLRHTESLVADMDRPAASEEPRTTPRDSFTRVLTLRAELDRYSMGAPEWLRTLGMYQGARIRPHLEQLYAIAVRRLAIQAVMVDVSRRLTDFGFKYKALPKALPTPEEQQTHYDLLRLALLLSEPKRPSEPALEELPTQWLVKSLTAHLQRLEAQGLERVDKQTARRQPGALKALAEDYLAFVRTYPGMLFARDKQVIVRARRAMSRVPAADQALARIVTRVAEEGYDLDLRSMLGPTEYVESGEKVRGAFTRRGWDNIVRGMLSDEITQHAGELWVIGTADADDGEREQAAKLRAEVSAAYHAAYIAEWQRFLRSVRVRVPSSEHRVVLKVIRALLRGQTPPIKLLLSAVQYNTDIRDKTFVGGLKEQAKSTADDVVEGLKRGLRGALGGKQATSPRGAAGRRPTPAIQKPAVTEKDVHRAFADLVRFAVPAPSDEGAPAAPVAYTRYEEQLHYVSDALQGYFDNPDSRGALMGKLHDARVEVRSLIDQQSGGFRPVLEALLWPPIKGAATSSSAAVGSSVAARWCQDVYSPFTREIAGYYPFKLAGHDLPLEALATFYKRDGGVVSAFLDNVLGSSVKRQGRRFTFTRQLGADGEEIFKPALLEFLRRSSQLSDAFFPGGAETARVDLEVRIHPSPTVHSTSLGVGGRSIEYHNGPERWYSLSWPGGDPLIGASLQVRGANGMHEEVTQDGVWGLYRLIEAGTVTRTSPTVFTVAWQLRTHDVIVRMDFRPTRADAPFFARADTGETPAFLGSLRSRKARPHARILKAGAACKTP